VIVHVHVAYVAYAGRREGRDVERPTARCERESERASMPPRLWALVDEAALRRPVAAPEVMYEQCMASACPRPVADRPRDT
jgi:hypothetical protein